MEPTIWLVNKQSQPIDICIIELKKYVTFETDRPVPLPQSIAMKYRDSFKLNFCDDPEKYFQGQSMRELVVRDAGIGDLLLLEPVLRQANINKRDITICCMYPEIFVNNPHIAEIVRMHEKGSVPVKYESFDYWEDLRNYSETCESRARKHRTDCYNEKFSDSPIEDKEPRLYFTRDEKNESFVREAGKKYIGIEFDASHYYRKYNNGDKVIEHIIGQDENNVVVIFGSHDFIKMPKSDNIIDLQEKTTIRQAILAIRDLDCLIAVDSGLMHVAMAMHIPTTCIFSIVHPKLRTEYYTGAYNVIFTDMDCGGCGSLHMAVCKHGDYNKDQTFIPPCMQISPQDIYAKAMALPARNEPRIFYSEKKEEPKKVNINRIPKHKITLPIIVLNEAKNLPRFIELVMKHPCIGRTIAIDGGSTDNTVSILQSAGAQVYVHPYDKQYHDAQAMQRNYSFSFVSDGERCIMMDIDECFSDELSDYLYCLAESNIEYGEISRRTFAYYADINNPAKQIKNYPDYQPRWYIWNRKFKFVGSPHHQTLNVPQSQRIKKDIIHFESEGKNRDLLEKEWAVMWNKTKEIYK